MFMASAEYWEGRNLEKNEVLKETVARVFNFDRVDSDGGSGTKGDIIGFNGDQRTHVSVKYASGVNTQVHLSTLRSVSTQLDMPKNIYDKLDKFLGTNDTMQWVEWSTGLKLSSDEIKYKRLNSSNITDWEEVPSWFNANSRKIAILLLQSLKESDKAKWLIWANKKKGGIQAVDINQLIDWIVESCTWITMPKGTVLRCAISDKASSNAGKPIFFLQMKNSGGPPGGYNHNPQFHLNSNWPKKFVVYEDTKLRF
jgi:hypothetical protein